MTAGAEPAPPREVRPLRPGDAPVTASLHAQALPDGFFAQLGARFLRAYHRSYADSPHAVALVSVSGGQVDGFLLGVLAPPAHGAYVLRAWGPRLASRAVLSLLVRPRLLAVFLRTRLLRYARGLWRRRRPAAAVAGPSAAGGTWAVLSHVAVDSERRGSGAGAALVQVLHDRVRSADAAGVVLLTSVEGAAPSFYRRLGYEDEGEVVGADGQQWLRFRWRAP